jgi:phosphoglycolate phosphatase
MKSRAHTVVLFDIDGTILRSDGAGRRAVTQALIEVFGTAGPSDVWFDGKTDPQIVRELMRRSGHADAHIDERMPRLLEIYVDRLRAELRDPEHPPQLLPGIESLLDLLEARDDVTLGLLTGNVLDGACAKLEAVGIAPSRFRVGAFGSDHELRPELPAIAQRRAREVMEMDIAGDRLVVIGDTPADVTCGRAVGARAIGVATGRYGVGELASHGAVAVFEDLSDTAAVVHAILHAQASLLHSSEVTDR